MATLDYLLRRVGRLGVRRRTLSRLGRSGDGEYATYLGGQLDKTIKKLEKDSPLRYGVMIKALEELGVGGESGVLCVGCRNAYELDAFERAGFIDVKGIDLVSTDRRILVMDMGKMEFADNSFSVVYAGDSLEHAYDVEQAVAEFCRVVKDGGVIAIEMPIKYETNQIDRWDVGGVAGLRALFTPHVRELKTGWREEQPGRLRVIFQAGK